MVQSRPRWLVLALSYRRRRGGRCDVMNPTRPIGLGGASGESRKEHTYLRLCRDSLIVTVGGGAERGTGAIFSSADATTLGQVLLALGFANLDLLLLAPSTELFGLESALGLELGAAMFGNVAVSHGEGCEGDAPLLTRYGGWRDQLRVQRVLPAGARVLGCRERRSAAYGREDSRWPAVEAMGKK